MKLFELIEQLTDLQNQIGPDAIVNTWNNSREPVESLAVRPATGVRAGFDQKTEKPTAVIRFN